MPLGSLSSKCAAYRGVSATTLVAVDPHSLPEAGFRQRYENPVRGTVCRKTHDFPVSTKAALIGRLTAFSENACLPARREDFVAIV